MSHIAPDRADEQSATPMDHSQDGHQSVSIFGKVKHRAQKLRDKVKDKYDHRNDSKEEESEEEEEEDQSVEKPDENVEGLTHGLAGLSGLGAANKNERSNTESETANKSTLGDRLNIEEEKTEDPDDLRRKESMLTEAKEKPREDFEETEQGGGKRGDAIAEKEENGTDFAAPSITQKAGVAMAGATGGMLGLGKGNKQEEEPNSSEFTKPPAALKEVPKPLEEEYQNLLEKSKAQENVAVEGNGLRSDEKPTGEDEFGAKKSPGLLQGLKNSLTSDQSKKDAILPEEQSRENQDQGMQIQGEDETGQGYAQKLYSAKNVISSKLGYGGPPSEQKAAVAEPEGENKETAPIGEEKLDKSAVDEFTGEEKLEKSDVNESKGEEKLEKSGVHESIGEEKREKSTVDESTGEEKLQGSKTEEGTENKQTFKSTLVSKLSPGEDDKALSQVITEAFNSSAKTLLGGFYGGSPKTEVPPSPSPSSKTEEAAELTQNSNPQNSSPPSPPQGIVGRVTGVMSSFMGKKPTKEDVDNSSPHTQDPAYGDHKEELSGSSETQTGNRIEDAAK